MDPHHVSCRLAAIGKLTRSKPKCFGTCELVFLDMPAHALRLILDDVMSSWAQIG